MQQLRPMVTNMFTLSNKELGKLNYLDISGYADNVVAKTFEGIKMKY